MKKEIKMKIKKIAEKISKIKNVKAVYLFGSYATGKQNNLSDIDICVIGNLTEKEETDALLQGSEKIDITIFSKLPIYIKFKVFKEGIPIVINDEIFLENLRAHMLWEYLDFRQLINKHMAITLGVKNEQS